LQQSQHLVWYKFTIEKTGVLLFDIVPTNPKDNYDFMLFKASANFCSNYTAVKETTIRSNYMPSENNIYGQTGLSINGKLASYEKGIEVKKGDSFYLVLNNLYPNGKGHTLIFRNLATHQILGNITNSKNGNPLKSIVKWSNLRDENFYIETSTEKKGEYNMQVAVNNDSHSFPKYELFIYSDKFFPVSKIFSTEEVNKLNNTKVDFSLNKVRKGYNDNELGPIYFQPNDDEFVQASDSILKKMTRLMQLNKKIEIVLEGHTNGIYPSTYVDQQLSTNRAEKVKRYFVEKGIDESRITVKGFGSTKEIYPTPENEKEEGYNRRVEINIVKI